MKVTAGDTFIATVTGAPSGRTGDLGVTITLNDTPIVARTTDGITESPTGSGTYHVELTAPAFKGLYVIHWDLDGTWATEQLRVLPDGLESPKPSLADVAAQLWARTVDNEQETIGEFTADTQPTAAQAQAMLDQAYEDVRAVCVAGEIPERSYAAAHRAITLRAAYLIELSYFPEQTTDASESAYLQLRDQYKELMASFTTVGQMRDGFRVT